MESPPKSELSGGCPFSPDGNDDVAKQKRFVKDRIDTHKNARLTPKGRGEMVRTVVDGRLAKATAARRANASAAGGAACPSLS